MKISKNTLEVLNNYVQINDSIILKPGGRLATKAIVGQFISKASCEEFPITFPIYQLANFLSAVSLFKDPDFEFVDNVCTITEGKTKITYLASTPSFVQNDPPENDNLPEFDVVVKLSSQQLSDVKKASKLMNQEIISFQCKDGNIYLRTDDPSKPVATQNHFQIELESGTGIPDFNVMFKESNLKFLPGDYTVSFSCHGINEFRHKDTDLVYWLGCHTKSTKPQPKS